MDFYNAIRRQQDFWGEKVAMNVKVKLPRNDQAFMNTNYVSL